MTGDTNRSDSPGKLSLWHLLKLRNFRWLWLGQLVSLLGDQVHFVALTWLVLQVAENAFTVGSVLAINGIPRALFMLVGGAFTDRFSPKIVMLFSNLLRMILVALLAAIIFAGHVELWMLYTLALIFGAVDAFFFPASVAIVPQLVEANHLQSANGMLQGTAQICQLIGPLVAAAMIALLGTDVPTEVGAEPIPEIQGLDVAFAFDAATFLVSTITLSLIRLDSKKIEVTEQIEPRGVLGIVATIQEGLKVVWADRAMRALFLLSAAINFLFVGPFWIGMPILADSRFSQGAAAYGIVMGAYGGGMLLGTLAVGVLPQPAPRHLGSLLLIVISALGLGLVIIGFSSPLWLTVLTSVGMGIANGYVNILFITWLQSHTPTHLLGRVMSFMLFASVGLVPLSLALSGALIQLNSTLLLAASGTLLMILTLWAATIAPVRSMGLASESP
jgi:hypothetical protein